MQGYYRWQRFKPFGLWTVFLVCEILQAAEVQTLWLVDRVYLVIVSLNCIGSNPVGL